MRCWSRLARLRTPPCSSRPHCCPAIRRTWLERPSWHAPSVSVSSSSWSRPTCTAASICSTSWFATISRNIPITCWRRGSPAEPSDHSRPTIFRKDSHVSHHQQHRTSCHHRVVDGEDRRAVDDLVRRLPARRSGGPPARRPGGEHAVRSRRRARHRRGPRARPGLGSAGGPTSAAGLDGRHRRGSRRGTGGGNAVGGLRHRSGGPRDPGPLLGRGRRSGPGRPALATHRQDRPGLARLPRGGMGGRLDGHHVDRRRGLRRVHRLRVERRPGRDGAHRGPPRPPWRRRQRLAEDPMSRHVVFGTGQIGRPLIELLVSQGHEVTAVNRGGGAVPGADVVAGDATDAAFTTTICKGSDAVYFCLNATGYARWAEEFPPLQQGVLVGATRAQARLVVLENLYAYGAPGGRHLVESMPARPTSTKSATRAAMTDRLLAAHRAGQVEVAIGRASDYYGPGATSSALGENVFGAALTGKTAQVMGDPDQPHSYSYTADVAAALATLGTAAGATGRAWHLP